MKDKARRDASQKIANSYAPRPQHSLVTSAMVGAVLAGLALLLFGKFYTINMAAHPVIVGATICSIAAGSIVVWIVRLRQHKDAHRREYDKTNSG